MGIGGTFGLHTHWLSLGRRLWHARNDWKLADKCIIWYDKKVLKWRLIGRLAGGPQWRTSKGDLTMKKLLVVILFVCCGCNYVPKPYAKVPLVQEEWKDTTSIAPQIVKGCAVVAVMAGILCVVKYVHQQLISTRRPQTGNLRIIRSYHFIVPQDDRWNSLNAKGRYMYYQTILYNCDMWRQNIIRLDPPSTWAPPHE